MTPAPSSRPVSDWLLILLGLLLAGFGVYWIVQSRGVTRTGFVLLSFGLLIMPLLPLRVLGGLGLMSVGGWLAANALGSFHYVYALILLIVGGNGVWDGVRAWLLSSPPPPPEDRAG